MGKNVPCPACAGSGKSREMGKDKCDWCNGTGEFDLDKRSATYEAVVNFIRDWRANESC